MEHVSHLGCKI